MSETEATFRESVVMTAYQPPTSQKWQVGQRVERTKPTLGGTIVEVDGRMNVKWDNGAVSYYSLHQSRHIKPARDQRDPLAARYRAAAAQQPAGAQRDFYLQKADELEQSDRKTEKE